MQNFDVRLDNDDFVQNTQISPHFFQNLEGISNDEGSEDDFAFDNHMAQQEHGARNRYR